MFNIRTTLVIGFVGICTALSVYAKPAAKHTAKGANVEDVDFKAVNPLLQAIAQFTIQGDDQVEFAYPEFDTKLSSLENERLVYSVNGRITNGRWKKYGSDGKALVSGTVDLKADRTAVIPGMDIVANTKTTGDVVPMINFLSEAGKTNYNDEYPAFKDRIFAILDRGMQVETLAEVYQVIVDSQKLSLEIIRSKLKDKIEYQKCIYRMECGNPTVDQWGNRQPDWNEEGKARNDIQIQYRLQSAYEAVSVAINKTGTELSLSSTTPGGFFAEEWQSGYNATEAKYAELKLTRNSITSKLKMFKQADFQELDHNKKNFSTSLNGVIKGDSEETEKMQKKFRNALIQFKKAMNGQK